MIDFEGGSEMAARTVARAARRATAVLRDARAPRTAARADRLAACGAVANEAIAGEGGTGGVERRGASRGERGRAHDTNVSISREGRRSREDDACGCVLPGGRARG